MSAIIVYTGPMWAGKTSVMCRDLERYMHARKKCVIIKFVKDTRYNHLSKSGGIVAHSGIEYSKVPIIETEKLSDVDVTDYYAIGVDEAQFYQDAPEIIGKWSKMGKHIVISALDSTWQMKPFPVTAEIIAMADRVEKLNAVCMKCGSDAPFTAKIAGSNEIEEIGGKDKYIAVCRKCFHE